MNDVILLKIALQNEMNYSVQYVDYDENTWTVPVKLTAERYQLVMTDHSIKRIRVEQVIELN